MKNKSFILNWPGQAFAQGAAVCSEKFNYDSIENFFISCVFDFLKRQLRMSGIEWYQVVPSRYYRVGTTNCFGQIDCVAELVCGFPVC